MEGSKKRKKLETSLSDSDSNDSNLEVNDNSFDGSNSVPSSQMSLQERIEHHILMIESQTGESEPKTGYNESPEQTVNLMETVHQHLNMLSQSHSGLESEAVSNDIPNDFGSLFPAIDDEPMLSQSHSALEFKAECKEILNESGSTLPIYDQPMLSPHSAIDSEADCKEILNESGSTIPIHDQPMVSQSQSAIESEAHCGEILNESGSTVPIYDQPVRHFNMFSKSFLQEDTNDNTNNSNGINNISVSSSEIFNTRCSPNPNCGSNINRREPPVVPEILEHRISEHLEQRVSDHLQMLHDSLNKTQESSLNKTQESVEPDGDNMTQNKSLELNEVKSFLSNAKLLDTSGAANESWASTPVKIPPSVLFQTVMSPVKLSFEDSNESVESDESSCGSEEENLCSSESSFSHSSRSTESESDSEYILNQSIFSCNSELNNQTEIDVDTCPNFKSKVLEAVRLSNLNLFEGSDLSVIDAILQIMNLFLKNKESKVGLRRIVKSMSSLLPKGHNLPSMDHILSLVQGLVPSVSEESHFFCKVCLVYREAGTTDQPCFVCDKITPVGEFFVFSVRVMVKYLFEYCNLASILDSATVNQDDNLIRDISDGTIYKTLNANRSKYDLTLVLNSDGVRIRKGSKSELWVLLGTFVEIPIHLREAFISVFGLWYDEAKPDNMNTFLEPFSKEMVEISESGVEWTHPITTEKNVSEVRVQLVVADAPARAKLQNILNFNGKQGCNVCEIKSVKCLPNPAFRKRIRIYPYKHNLKLRTAVRMETQARQAVARGETVKGVKGPSVLSIIPSVDIATCFIPEYLHSVLIGVVNALVTLWISRPGPWNIKNSLYTIDAELGNICHPDFVHRVSRHLKKVSVWKASDYYYFLLFESLPVLKEFLPEVYFQHYILLVRAIFQLLMRGISEFDLEEADLCLKLFVNAYGGLYTDRDLTSNVHQLLHLSLSVKRHGPLSCTSAFAFESMNGTIAKATHGTNNVGKEIANNIKICKGIVVLKKISEGLHGYAAAPVFATEPLGTERKGIEITHEERDLLIGDFKIYSRAKIGYEVFTSLIHKQLKSVNYYVMCKINGAVEYASIKYFVKHNDNLKVCLKLFDIDHLNVIYNRETLKTIQHLIPVRDSDRTVVVHGDILLSFVKVGKVRNFIFKRPNLFHQVM